MFLSLIWNERTTMRKEHTEQTKDRKNLDNNYNTNTDNFKGNSNKNKMVNKENSDHNTRKEENKNNSQKITFAQS